MDWIDINAATPVDSKPIFQHLSIKGLYHRTDIEIEFDTTNPDDSIRIIYGLNGCGKSSVMRLIDAVLNWKHDVFWKIPFDEFTIKRERLDYGITPLASLLRHDSHFLQGDSTVFIGINMADITDDLRMELIETGLLDDEYLDVTVNNGDAELEFPVKTEYTFTVNRQIDRKRKLVLNCKTTIQRSVDRTGASEEENMRIEQLLQEVERQGAAFISSSIFTKEMEDRKMYWTDTRYYLKNEKVQEVLGDLIDFSGAMNLLERGKLVGGMHGWGILEKSTRRQISAAELYQRYIPVQLIKSYEEDESGEIVEVEKGAVNDDGTPANHPKSLLRYMNVGGFGNWEVRMTAPPGVRSRQEVISESKQVWEERFSQGHPDYLASETNYFNKLPLIHFITADRLKPASENKNSNLLEIGFEGSLALSNLQERASHKIKWAMHYLTKFYFSLLKMDNDYYGRLFIDENLGPNGNNPKGVWGIITTKILRVNEEAWVEDNGYTEDELPVNRRDSKYFDFPLAERWNNLELLCTTDRSILDIYDRDVKESWHEDPTMMEEGTEWSKENNERKRWNDFLDCQTPGESIQDDLWELLGKLLTTCGEEWDANDAMPFIAQGKHLDIDVYFDELDADFLPEIIQSASKFGGEYHGSGYWAFVHLEYAIEILEVVNAVNQQIQQRMPGYWMTAATDGRLYVRREYENHGGFDGTKEDPPDGGEVLHPGIMSSGEKHYILIFWELIEKLNDIGPRGGGAFGSAPPIESLIMIDEPEISMHANWQRAIVSDLENTFVRNQGDLSNGMRDCRFIIATHSPQVVGDHLHRTQGIGLGPEEREV